MDFCERLCLVLLTFVPDDGILILYPELELPVPPAPFLELLANMLVVLVPVPIIATEADGKSLESSTS